jgi:hypothetical protein
MLYAPRLGASTCGVLSSPRANHLDGETGKSVWCPAGALFSNFCEINILKFQKKYKNAVNYIHYESANFYYEIPCIATSAKKKKWKKVETCNQI